MRALAAAVVAAFVFAPPAVAAPAAAAAAPTSDVNGDGVADLVLATGARLTYLGDTALVPNDLGGSVYVIPGNAPAAMLNQDSPGVGLGMRSTDKFGAAIATGDFNGDGFADVAVGNPTETVGGLANAGVVTVLYGQRTAPYLRTIAGALSTVTQDSDGLPGVVEAGDLFGGGLAAGDFNGDGFADLAVGSPGEAIETDARAGAVWVLYGRAAGLTGTGSVAFNQDDANLAGGAEPGDLMGWSVAAGDVTGDGRDDLAVLSAGEVITGTADAWGSVHLIHGAAGGLSSAASSYVNVSNAATTGRWRGLVIGRFRGGATADLVIQADQRRGTAAGAGALVEVRGSASGLTTTTTVIDQAGAIPGTPEAGDHFGGSLAVGDLDGDGVDDLAAGELTENDRTGYVLLMRGGSAGLLSQPATAIGENTAPINAGESIGEGFGYGLAILDTTGDGTAELVVSAPWEDGTLRTGAIFVLGVGVSGSSLAVTSSRRVTRADIGTSSGFGPGAPFAGSSLVLNDNQETPR